MRDGEEYGGARSFPVVCPGPSLTLYGPRNFNCQPLVAATIRAIPFQNRLTCFSAPASSRFQGQRMIETGKSMAQGHHGCRILTFLLNSCCPARRRMCCTAAVHDIHLSPEKAASTEHSDASWPPALPPLVSWHFARNPKTRRRPARLIIEQPPSLDEDRGEKRVANDTTVVDTYELILLPGPAPRCC